jgi:hypothetical protein
VEPEIRQAVYAVDWIGLFKVCEGMTMDAPTYSPPEPLPSTQEERVSLAGGHVLTLKVDGKPRVVASAGIRKAGECFEIYARSVSGKEVVLTLSKDALECHGDRVIAALGL